MKLRVTGQMQELDVDTVQNLLAWLGLDCQAVAVELNKQVIPKRLHQQTELHEDDEVELVTLVGGG